MANAAADEAQLADVLAAPQDATNAIMNSSNNTITNSDAIQAQDLPTNNYTYTNTTNMAAAMSANMSAMAVYPTNTPSLARYDSGMFGEGGTTTSDDEEDFVEEDMVEDDDEEEEEVMGVGLANSELMGSGLEDDDASRSSFDREDDRELAPEDLNLPIIEGTKKKSPEPEEEAISEADAALLLGLPQTYRPFLASSGGERRNMNTTPSCSLPTTTTTSAAAAATKSIDYSYLSTQPFHGDTHDTVPIGGHSKPTAASVSRYNPTTKSSGTSTNNYLSTQPFHGDTHDAVPIGGYGDPIGGYMNSISSITPTPPTAAAATKPTRQLYNYSLPQIPLSSLPIDALHATSSYCTPSDWANLACTSKGMHEIGREVFGKVWRHAGRCMIEVGVAWARGEHADARELASLYIAKGVPIYPTPHGHSYHTIAWRMGLELQQDQQTTNDQEGENENNGTAGGTAAVGNGGGARNNDTVNNNSNGDDDNATNENKNTDLFYTDRYDNNSNHGRDSLFSRNHLTFVEEKSIFWKKKKGIEVNSTSNSPAPQSRGALFPRRFSLGNTNNGTNNNNHVARGPPPPQDPPLPGLHAAASQAAAAAGIGLARPPAPIAQRPQSAIPGPRFGAWAEANGGSTNNNASLSSTRYVRRSSFSGTGSFTSGARDLTSPWGATATTTNSSFSSASPNRSPSMLNLSRASDPLSGAAALAANDNTPSAPKMTLRIHRHLADQHFFGSPSINDESGTMNAGKMSMNADFFHPTWEGRRGLLSNSSSANNGANLHVENWDGYWDGTGWRTTTPSSSTWGRDDIAPTVAPVAPNEDIGETIDRGVGAEAVAGDRTTEDGNYREAVRAFVNWTLANADRNPDGNNMSSTRRNSDSNTAAGQLQALLSNPSSWTSNWGGMNHSTGRAMYNTSTPAASTSPAADVHLEVYSSSSANLKSDDEEDKKSAVAVANMRTKCEWYQNKLNKLLKSSNYDTLMFQETLLDFWDEMFPTTAGIHFYNQQSPVPRMSSLHKFLTTPCPKAIGTVQCEIERVKVSSKSKEGKGMKGLGRGTMKGKFFPSYEYRLFIRDTKNDNPFQQSRSPPRRDSVLLVAKNKAGKNRNVASNTSGGGGGSGVGGIEFAGGMASPSTSVTSKRGQTRYYMCLPNQRDVDSHFKSANRNNSEAALQPGQKSGLVVSPMASSSKSAIEVGRLQSNFIGTEFQIFVPQKQIQQQGLQRNAPQYDLLETSSAEGDSRVHPIEATVPVNATGSSSANTSSKRIARRGSGLVRLARRASGHLSRRGSMSRRNNEPADEPAEEEPHPQRRGSKKAIRRMSWGTSSTSTNKKMNRRAIANNSEACYDGGEAMSSSSMNSPVAMGEIENGAITYTANLLGNRPRIMDVCIPKLGEDGRVCDEWSGEQQQHENGGANYSNGGGSSTNMLDRFKTIQQGLEGTEDNMGMNNQGSNNESNTNTDSNNHSLMVLQNRPPWWNIELGAFVLNFGGRVKVASVKNFQLCERNDQDHIMQFGRIEGRHAFTMDFQHPLTPMQAFAIAISSLQSKISFG